MDFDQLAEKEAVGNVGTVGTAGQSPRNDFDGDMFRKSAIAVMTFNFCLTSQQWSKMCVYPINQQELGIYTAIKMWLSRL